MKEELEIKTLNLTDLELPKHETVFSAGVDLRADISNSVVLKPLERSLIGTGLKIALPPGYEAQVRPRSGLAYKHGITVLNSPGTIDSDYRGEIKVLLVNISDTAFEICRGDRIAQMVVAKYQKIKLIESDNLDETDRGSGGYGSTGKV
ncbi:MAG: dUTP pyrophosphatase [Bacteroidia bacterium]|jgi:dUTP pyrophosphatase